MRKYIVAVSILLVVAVWLHLVFVRGPAADEMLENFEHGRYCESLKTAEWLSKYNTRWNRLLASFHGRGLCVSQNIETARRLLLGAGNASEVDVGRTFLYFALDSISDPSSEKTQKEPTRIRALLNESKRLGYVASEKEKKLMLENGIAEIYSSIPPDR